MTASLSHKSIPTIISVDPHAAPLTEPNIHNRWHPDIPSVASVPVDKAFKVECMDFTGNFIRNDDCADDVLDFNWHTDHHLSGPINVEGAMPGDVLVIDILDVLPHPSRLWGFSLVDPGAGPLDRPHTRVSKTIWDFEGIQASSRHVKGVSFCGKPHMGVLGTAPSHEVLARWTKREVDLNVRYISHGHECAQEPTAFGAYVGQELPEELMQEITNNGARTKPAREHGGNIDCSSLTRGSRIYLPVYVEGAKLSVGDPHFSLGDGEPTCAIEMAGVATLKCSLIKQGMSKLKLDAPMAIYSPAEPLYRKQLAFHGISVDPAGIQQRSSLTTSYIRAASSAICYLETMGYSHEQGHMLLACAPVETRVLATPNIPNANVSVALPLDIFQDDIRPGSVLPSNVNRGSAAYLSEARETEWLEKQKPLRTPFMD